MSQFRKIITIIFFGLLALVTGVYGQSAISAAGGESSGSGGSASYSFGQLVYHTHLSAFGTVAEGLQQPHEISMVTGLAEHSSQSLGLLIYPNPVRDMLIAVVQQVSQDYPHGMLEVFDVHGKMVQARKLTDRYNSVYVGDLPSGVYFVRVNCGEKLVQSLKLIKQ